MNFWIDSFVVPLQSIESWQSLETSKCLARFGMQDFLITELPIEQIAKDQFDALADRTFGPEMLLNPKPGTVESVARKYALTKLKEHRGKFTQGDIQKTLTQAAFALNRAVGKRWTDGAIELVAPIAAKQLGQLNSSNIQKISATYLAILAMPAAYSGFIKVRNLEVGHIITKSELKVAWSMNQRCGVFPFC